MSKSDARTVYRQCELSRGPVRQMAWIPEKFAHCGRTLKIKEEDGWKVDSVGARLGSEQLALVSRSYRYTREASDC